MAEGERLDQRLTERGGQHELVGHRARGDAVVLALAEAGDHPVGVLVGDLPLRGGGSRELLDPRAQLLLLGEERGAFGATAPPLAREQDAEGDHQRRHRDEQAHDSPERPSHSDRPYRPRTMRRMRSQRSLTAASAP